MSKDKNEIGKELNQLSRFLFDSAADNWYLAVLLQIIAGVFGTIFALIAIPEDFRIVPAVIGFLIMASAYFLRLKFEEKYERAETMRRQSALTEGLAWPISETQATEWRRRVGKNILQRFDKEPRSDDYYGTQENVGPKKLLEMTIESAFYTRILYAKLKDLLLISLFIAAILSFLVVTLLHLKFIPKDVSLQVAYAIYLLLPIVLSLDLLGLVLKLSRLTSSIFEIEKDLEILKKESNITDVEIVRLVSEYNCQLACGVPIHQVLFKRWHNEINALWEKRKK